MPNHPPLLPSSRPLLRLLHPQQGLGRNWQRPLESLVRPFHGTATLYHKDEGVNHKKVEEPASSSPSIRIPAPTWSVRDSLSSSTIPHTDGSASATATPWDLSALARRALVHLPQDPDELARLEQDMQQLQQFLRVAALTDDNSNHEFTDVDLYDRPRGVHEAPVREPPTNTDEHRNGDSSPQVASSVSDEGMLEPGASELSQKVWNSMLAPKTRQLGGHSFFCIPTAPADDKRENKTKESSVVMDDF